MGCATASFCWFKPQQVNIFSARGGATWAEPICVERRRGRPLRGRDSSDEEQLASVGQADPSPPSSPVSPGAGRCALQRKRASQTSGKRIHAPRPPRISMCSFFTQSLPSPCEKSHVRGMGASGRVLRGVLRTGRRSAVVQ
ncbi:hypothetical protein OJAV_G00089380 [Oryzias javanicus]|uniref:Uncharacterized protein n=1 Tax=Oryzias javanicus TaxID=123683 RepID=A0A3S2P783_ORYJA|nr:hypothetical protein OJAV_G00089380 [Oryzias javanicus]